VHINASHRRLQGLQEGHVLYFPAGLLGFPQHKHYQIRNYSQEVPFRWLQAMDDPPLAFVIIDPFAFLPDYGAELQEQDLHDLNVIDPLQLTLFAIVTLPRETSPCFTVNLQGPVLVNCTNSWSKQLVLVNSQYHTQHALLVAAEAPS
jgi:flagellar assembly factor FliW